VIIFVFEPGGYFIENLLNSMDCIVICSKTKLGVGGVLGLETFYDSFEHDFVK